ncbi:hypothetical protein ILUMI_17467, partial [Ignelater luminosus]
LNAIVLNSSFYFVSERKQKPTKVQIWQKHNSIAPQEPLLSSTECLTKKLDRSSKCGFNYHSGVK